MTFSGEMMMALLIIGAVVFFCRDRRWVAWLVAAGGLIGVALVAAETRSMWAGAAVRRNLSAVVLAAMDGDRAAGAGGDFVAGESVRHRRSRAVDVSAAWR